MEKPIKSPEEFIAEELGIPVSEMGVDEIKKRKEKKDNVVETSFLETEDYILEQIDKRTHRTHWTHSQEGICFLKYKKQAQTESIEEVKEFTYKDKLYKPIVNKITENNAVLLPSGVEEYGTTEKLITEISDFMFNYFDPPKYYDKILPNLLLFYYLSDKFPFVPYLHFVGLTGTGKTTALEVFGSISYKAIDAAGAITPASLFRLAHDWRGTLLLDEFEIGGKNGEAYTLMVQILKSGVSDKPIFRVEGEKKREVEIYVMKSPRVFTSQNPIMDAALQSRTILVRMNKTTKKLPLYRLQSFFEKAQELRNKLLLWRLRNLNSVKLEDIEYGVEKLSVFDRRIQQVLTPIYYLSDKNTKKEIVKFAKEKQEDDFIEKREELDGRVFTLIYEDYKDGVQTTLSSLSERLGGKNPVSERKLSNIVRKILKFSVERITSGGEKQSLVKIKKEVFDDLCTFYGYPLLEGNPIESVFGTR